MQNGTPFSTRRSTRRSIRRSMCRTAGLAMIAAGLLMACSSTPDTSERRAETLYAEAQRQLQNGNWESAVQTLEELETRFPFSEFARQAQLEEIYAYYRGDIVEAAESAADRFIRENPTHPQVDYAYYMKGVIFFSPDPGPLERLFDVDLSRRPAENAEKSFRNFKTLVERFPDSEYAPDARQRMIHLHNRLARFEVHVANYYMERQIWLAAANRAKVVLERFPQSPALPDALEIMIEAYEQLGMDAQAEDARRTLQASLGGSSRADVGQAPTLGQVPRPSSSGSL